MPKIRIYISVAVLATGLFAAPGIPQDDRPLLPQWDGALAGYPPSRSVPCGYPHVSLSPDGTMFVMMSNSNLDTGLPIVVDGPATSESNSGVHVVDSACFRESGLSARCLLGRIAVPAGVAIAWWSTDSRHVFANGGGRMAGFSIDPSARHVTMVGEPRNDLNAWYQTLAVVGPTPSISSEQEWQRFRSALGWVKSVRQPAVGKSPFSMMRVTLRTEGMSASGTITGSLDLGVIPAALTTTVESTGFRVTSFGSEERPIVLPDESGRLWAIEEAEALRQVDGATGEASRWEQGPRLRMYGKRPILDSASGRLLGVHTERDIVWAQMDSVLEGFRIEMMRVLPEDAVLHAVEYSRPANVAIATFYQVNVGLTRLVFQLDGRSGKWRSGGMTCPISDEHRNQPKVTVRGYDAGEPGWPVMARLYSRANSRRLVVLLHGGLNRSVLYDDVGLWMVRSGSSGGKLEDIVSYDPSGLGGVDATVADRLATYGGAALERDADLIARDVLHLAASYDEIVLRVASYGGVLLPDVANRLGERLTRAYVTAPLMRHRLYDDLPVENHNDRRLGNSLTFKEISQRLHYGLNRDHGEKRFDRWLLDRYSRFRPDHRFMFVFGSQDELSRPGDLPHPGTARVVVLEGGHHVPQARSGPECWVSGDCSPDELKGGNAH
jgi:hypothetical protein